MAYGLLGVYSGLVKGLFRFRSSINYFKLVYCLFAVYLKFLRGCVGLVEGLFDGYVVFI